MRDQLYVLRPGFDDQGKQYFCPFSAQVMGYLSYFPEIRATLEIIELDFPKPRHPLSDVLDEQHQAAPMLVLTGEAGTVPGVEIGEVNGRKFVEKTTQIMRYLAGTRDTPMPH